MKLLAPPFGSESNCTVWLHCCSLFPLLRKIITADEQMQDGRRSQDKNSAALQKSKETPQKVKVTIQIGTFFCIKGDEH